MLAHKIDGMLFERLGAEASRPALEDVAVMEEPNELGGDVSGFAEQLTPILDGAVRGEEPAGAFVTSHDELEKVFRSRGGELFIPRSSTISSALDGHLSEHFA